MVIRSFVVAMLACLSLQAQEPDVYDAELAKKLNADKNGMKRYVVVFLKTGPATEIKGPALDSLFKGHMQTIQSLAANGSLVTAGPFSKNADGLRGIFILNVSTVEEAQKLCASDPTIKAGVFSVSYYPWYGSAAIQEVNAIHERIAKPD
jgi:uncharacterized protein YciI